MRAFQGLLVAMFIGIVVYTLIAGSNYGWNIVPILIEEITSLTWQGQFNFDFVCYLILSGVWLAWRHNFSVGGIVLGIIASIMGILLFAPYLLFITIQSKGDMKIILLGNARANA